MPPSASSEARSAEDYELQTPLLKQEGLATSQHESDQEQYDFIAQQGPSRPTNTPSRRSILLGVALVVAIAIVGGTVAGLAKSDAKAKRYFGPPPTIFAAHKVTPGPAEVSSPSSLSNWEARC